MFEGAEIFKLFNVGVLVGFNGIRELMVYM